MLASARLRACQLGARAESASTATRQPLARLGQRALECDRAHRERTTGVRLEAEHDPAALLVEDPEQRRTAPELGHAAADPLAVGDDDGELVARVNFGMEGCVKDGFTRSWIRDRSHALDPASTRCRPHPSLALVETLGSRHSR